MKIAITCQEDTLDSVIDQTFGRCKYFLIVDIEDNKIINTNTILNTSTEEAHGAGIKAVEKLANLKVDTLITGQVGPNAESVLKKLNINVLFKSGNIKDALKEFLNKPDIKKENTNKMFFPLLNDNSFSSEISLHFGHAPFFGIYDFNTKDLKIVKNTLDHTNTEKSPISQICESFNINIIFAKDIGGRAIQEVKNNNVSLKTGDFNTVKDVLENFENLKNLENSCGH